MDCPLTSIIIPSSVTSIKDWAFSCPKLISVTVNREKPLAIDGTVFSNRANATLYVPYGCKDAYEAAKYWTDFMEIVEMPGPNILTIDESGFATYCSGQALDFTTVKDVKAYVATGFNFNKETLQLTQVTKVQAGEGLFISGKPGTYEIPECTTSIGYYNILQGVLSATSITPTSDGYSRFIFTDGEYGKFFYPISVPTDLAAGTAYLQLPTGVLPDDLTVIGLDLDGTVGVGEVESEELRMKNEKWAGAVYSLDGRPIAPSTSVNGTLPKGIYVRGGRKVVIK